MKDLSIGMPIYADTTLLLWSEICKLHATTVEDAYTTSNDGELRIKLGNHHDWGACPTRSRKDICISEKEVKEFALRDLAKRREKYDNANEKQFLFLVECTAGAGGGLTISEFYKSRTVNSLKEGTFTEYRGDNQLIKIYNEDNMEIKYMYFSIDEAIDKFARLAYMYLRK